MRPRSDPFDDPADLIRRVYAYVAYRLGPGAEADDVVGDTFERALRYRHAYDPRRGEPVAWLVGIARRQIAQRPRLVAAPLTEAHEQRLAGDLAAEAVARVDLAQAVRVLSERERELLALRYGADLTAREIGELLKMKTNAIEVALHRALGRLRDHLDERAAQSDVAPGTKN